MTVMTGAEAIVKSLRVNGVDTVFGLPGGQLDFLFDAMYKEGDGIRRYIHLGTGNYNEITAQVYEDLGMFTCDDEIGAEVITVSDAHPDDSAVFDERSVDQRAKAH